MTQTQLQFENFMLDSIDKKEILFKPLNYPVWTRAKAEVIRQYLFYFVMITKHGTYIDGFAGPQKMTKPEAWAAKLAVENEPPWFRRFFLFEMKKKKIECLNQLKECQPENIKREIKVCCGDFNELIKDFLDENPIGEKEASFCLLDQRTFECKWSTVQTIANHKIKGYKIELFYFLPIHWLDRAISGLKDKSSLENWWGRPDWHVLLKKKPIERATQFIRRFEDELGYKHVKPWTFYSRRGGGNIMYYMIHASDHPEAPKLMYRSYQQVIGKKHVPKQLPLFPV